jgi:endonuclease YncB( thermonuclease family)
MFTLLLAAVVACSQPIRVIDGDTIEVCNESGPERIRIANLDAPESYRPACAKEKLAGIEAKQEATRFFIRPSVDLDIKRHSKDRYGRSVADVSVNGEDFRQHMIEYGYGVQWRFNEKHNWCK